MLVSTHTEVKPDPFGDSFPPFEEDTDEETDVLPRLTDVEIKAELIDDENGSVYPGATIQEIYDGQPSADILKRKGNSHPQFDAFINH